MTAWTVACKAVRASDGNVKYAAVRCVTGNDGLPITNPSDAIAFAVAEHLDEIRRRLPGYELSDWKATPRIGTAQQQARAVNLS